MAKPQRVLLQPRMAPVDAQYITERAEGERRSLGEVIGLMVQENRLLRTLLKVEAPEVEVEG